MTVGQAVDDEVLDGGAEDDGLDAVLGRVSGSGTRIRYISDRNRNCMRLDVTGLVGIARWLERREEGRQC